MAEVYRDVPYGSHPNQKVNLYQPTDYDIVTEYGIPIRGVILWLHGGGWLSGSKDINQNNYTSYYPSSSWSYLQNAPGFDSGQYFDDDFCKAMADKGYFVISANYRLVADSSALPIYNTGEGEYPNNITDIEELYKYMVFPGYAPSSNINKPSWDLIVRYVGTYGLLVIGGSAGGHLAVAGAFEGAGKTGRWPKGIGSVISPLNLDYSSPNLLGPLGRLLIDSYVTSDISYRRLASPWWRTNSIYNPNGISYESYLGFSDIASAAKVQNKMRMYFFYNQNDNLVPLSTAEDFINWISSKLGSSMVKYDKVNEVDPRSGFYYKGVYNNSTTYTSFDVVLYNNKMYRAQRNVSGIAPSDPPNTIYWREEGETHNVLSGGVTWLTQGATFTFKQGMNFPVNNNKVRPTDQGWVHNTSTGFGQVRGMVYPRQRSYRYKAINTTPGYIV